MTAIAGLIGRVDEPERKVKDMLTTMKHRGLDLETVEVAENAALGARSATLCEQRGCGLARQGSICLVFDGELFDSRSDEVDDAAWALRQYLRYGRGFARYLDGAFACAVLDGDELIITRDSVGIRPLYYGYDEKGAFYFSSEMKGLVGVVEEVWELLPGTLCSNKGGVAAFLHQYPEVAIGNDFLTVRDQLKNCVIEAVEKRLADGAVGACLLSGGLDSSIIAAIVHQLGVDMPLITVGVEGAADVENSRIVAEHLGMEHHIRTFDRDEIQQLVPMAVRTLESFDEDCVSGTISNLIASSFASRWTNCILSGEGGDELFGGYHLLKDVQGEGAKLRMMEKLVAIAYNTALQRLDRSMMGSGIHYRTPFLDSKVIALALQIPVSWKIHEGKELIEKYILREAFRDILPDPIYRRVKLRFAAGAGTDGVMDEIAAGQITSDDYTANRKSVTGYQLSSPKELWYYRLFRQNFPAPSFERMVGRWDPFK